MEKWQVIGLLGLGLALLIAAVYVRARYGDKFELKTIDLVLIVLPLLIVLLASGKLQVLDAFGVKADFSALFADAAGAEIKTDILAVASPGLNELVEQPEIHRKEGVDKIPDLLRNKTEALELTLGYGRYYGPAIKKYFDALYASSYLEHLIILDQDRRLFGIYHALDIAIFFRDESRDPFNSFARWLNSGSQEARTELAALPGFIPADKAVHKNVSKLEVLNKMDSLRVDNLPVVDSDGRFTGTVERSRLVASLILEVNRRLQGEARASN